MRYTGTRHKALASLVFVIIALLVMASWLPSGGQGDLVVFGAVAAEAWLSSRRYGFNQAYAKSNVSVDLKAVDANTFGSVLLTQLQAGNAPDLFNVQSGAGSSYGVWRLARTGSGRSH